MQIGNGILCNYLFHHGNFSAHTTRKTRLRRTLWACWAVTEPRVRRRRITRRIDFVNPLPLRFTCACQ